MKETYTKTHQPVKPRYALFWGFCSLPLILAAACANVFAAAFGTFLFCLIYGLRQNCRHNRRLSEMARKLKEQGDA